MKRRLTKSNHNVVISGVLGGIAEYLGIDPTVLRVIYVVLTFASFGTFIFLYIALMFIIPSARSNRPGPTEHYYQQNHQAKSTKRKEAQKVDDDEDWSDF